MDKQVFLEEIFMNYLKEHNIKGYARLPFLLFGLDHLSKFVDYGNTNRWCYREYPDISGPSFDPDEWARDLFQSINDRARWRC